MDSDLAEAVDALKAVFQHRKVDCTFGKTPPEVVDALRKEFKIPSRYRNFLLAANPVRVESATPVERIRFLPAEELVAAQQATRTNEGNGKVEWKASWIVIAESALLGDRYFLDVSKPDPEGDCPVYTVMSGQEKLTPVLVGSSFAQFLRIVAMAMEVAQGFGDAIMDDEDEDSFREALAPKIKIIDAAALRAGHWT